MGSCLMNLFLNYVERSSIGILCLSENNGTKVLNKDACL